MTTGIVTLIITAIVSLGGIPLITGFLKKVLGGSKFAPIIALVLGLVYSVLSGLITGNPPTDLSGIITTILTGLGVGSGGIAAYDVTKKFTDTPPTK